MTPSDIEKTVLQNLKNNITKLPDLDLPDLLLYLTLYQIYYMFQHKTIPRSQGSQFKTSALDKHKLFKFYHKMFKRSVSKIIPTEKLRAELRKNPNLDTALQLIQIYSDEPPIVAKE